jgi:hypothetical protein
MAFGQWNARWKQSMIAKEIERILAFDCKYAEGVEKKEHTEGCCIKHLSPDYIYKLRATMASVTEGEKHSSMCTVRESS